MVEFGWVDFLALIQTIGQVQGLGNGINGKFGLRLWLAAAAAVVEAENVWSEKQNRTSEVRLTNTIFGDNEK